MGEVSYRPLFSVVIPLYNKADTIERAIRSVWSQSCTKYELIVVDDGSSDLSLTITKKLSEEKSFTFISQVNSGVSCARNKGAELAQGTFLAFLDAEGSSMQFNLIEKDLLLAAKKEPEKHKNLLVRVCGYSAAFVTLAEEVQDEIIRRAVR